MRLVSRAAWTIFGVAILVGSGLVLFAVRRSEPKSKAVEVGAGQSQTVTETQSIQQDADPTTHEAETSPLQTATQDTSDAQAQIPSPSGSTSPSADCYQNSTLANYFKETSETRQDFAEQSAGALGQNHIYATVGGKENEYLLFAAAPEDADSLEEWAAKSSADPSIRANLCTKGFAEVQYIVRDANMRQTLISHFRTDAWESFRYLQQRGGATPMPDAPGR